MNLNLSTQKSKIFLFLIIALWFSLEHFILGPFSYLEYQDEFDGPIVEFIVWAKNMLKYGEGLWLPNIVGGVDSAAISSHILRAIFLIFPNIIGYQIVTILKFFFAGYGTYCVSRSHLRLSEFSSLFGGILFMLIITEYESGYFGFSTLPIILILIDKCLQKISENKIAFFYVVPVAILFSFFSSITGVLPYALVLIILWFFFIQNEYKLKSVFWFLLIFTVICFLWQIQEIYALLANAKYSNRAHYRPPVFQINLLSDFHRRFDLKYALSLVLTILAILFSSFRNKKLNMILALIIFFTFGYRIVEWFRGYLAHWGLPYMRGVHAYKLFLNTGFLYSIAAAHVFEYIRNYSISIKFTKLGLKFFIQSICIVLIIISSFNIKLFNSRHWLSNAIFWATYNNEHFEKLSQQSPYQLFRVVSMTLAGGTYAALHDFETTEGFIGMYPFRYRQFFYKVIERRLQQKQINEEDYLEAMGNDLYLDYVFIYNLDLLSLANTKYIISQYPIEDSNLIPIATPEDQQYPQWWRYDVPHWWRYDAKLGRAIQRMKDNYSGRNVYYIYENKKVLPRFFIVGDYQAFSNHSELLNKMGKSDASVFKKIAFIEAEDEIHFKSHNPMVSKYRIQLKEYRPHKIVLEVDLDGDGILVVSNSYSPFWKVKVNGQIREIYPVNHAFWGVPVRQGDKRVVFYYDPPYSYKNIFKTFLSVL